MAVAFFYLNGEFAGFSVPFCPPTRAAYAVFKDGKWTRLQTAKDARAE